MQREGFDQVYQLDGGILKYFEDCGGEHYEGECFVFDKRVGVDSGLLESEITQCFNCLEPLSAADQADARYVFGESCPHCFISEADHMKIAIATREAAIAKATNPLPGSESYDNYRPLHISAKHDGQTLLSTLNNIFPQIAPEYWHERFVMQLILDARHQAVSADRQVRSGERYLHRMPATSEPDVNAAIRVLHEDSALVVLNKPAPLPLHPSGRFNRNTLQSILNQVYYPQKLRPIHRLDANTTGVIVFARTRYYAGQLQPQFASGNVEKIYLARIQGHPCIDSFTCDAPIGSSTTHLGGRGIDDQGAPAHTNFRVLRRFSDGTSLIEARPITGRTNQIRVHLWHLDWPIQGEQTYLRNQQLGGTQTHAMGDPPLCLHALSISFDHPLTGERTTFECAAPSWAQI
jgi:RluA family pseudouridine synthase